MMAHRSALASARKAAGYTQEGLAAALPVDRSTVIRWEAGDHAPLPYLWPKLARLLGCSQDRLREIIDGATGQAPSSERSAPTSVPGLNLGWLDGWAGWAPGTAGRKVTTNLGRANGRKLAERRRPRVGRERLAKALSAYYVDRSRDVGLWEATLGDRRVQTSILSREAWLNLACRLPVQERMMLRPTIEPARIPSGRYEADQAVRRLIEAAESGVRMTDEPIYRLLDVNTDGALISGEFGMATFTEYALTMDVLEAELSAAVAVGSAALPLRSSYLPDVASVLDVRNRLCAGGVLALCAIARPADPVRGERDYVLLVQERSVQVLNAVRALAVIPKAFHEPLSDYRADVQLAATLRREMEEELFGRADVDTTSGEQRAADPMHPSRLSEPMQWLTTDPDRLRMECTGFGLNLVSGNYEFACLVVIEDEEFWTKYGGHIEANWESARLRGYSALDADLLARLVADDSWSNEGLFAFLQGLRRLDETGGTRVRLPAVRHSLG